jgi:HEAT repeat protein
VSFTRSSWSLFAGVLVATNSVAAGINTTPAVARAGGGQLALSVAFDAAGQLRAAACAHEPCSLEGATPILVPADVAPHATAAHLRVVGIGLERTAIVVDIPTGEPDRAWTAVIAAPTTGTAPLIPFAGYTGFLEGIDGERSGPAVLIREEGIYVGTQQEGADLCGRPALLAPRVLDPHTLTLRAAKLQRLTDAERAAAPTLTAKLGPPTSSPPLLRAAWATSAAPLEVPRALTDGNLETRWAEGKSGVGRGEFAVLIAPRDVPIAGFSIAPGSAPRPEASPSPSVRPPGAPTPSPSTPAAAVKSPADKTPPTATFGAASMLPADAKSAIAPGEVWLATEHELFHVVLPPRGAHDATSVWQVELPNPVKTDCVAVVLESAATNEREARVGIGEIQGKPALGGSIDDLVKELSGGGERAATAGAILRVSGPDADRAVAVAYASLDEDGKRIALDVLDDAPCDVAMPAYVEALAGSSEAHRVHARSVLSRCVPVAADALSRALAQRRGKERALLADELAAIAPGAAITAIAPLLDKGSVVERRALRAIVAHAASASESRDAAIAALSRDDLGVKGTIDLLRALEPQLQSIGAPAARALARVLAADSSDRTRFLLLGPASVLANDAEAAAFVRRSLASDPNAHVRTEAARVLATPAAFAPELERSLADPDVRVREAAATALGQGRVDGAAAALGRTLDGDPWPLVRSAAALSLAELGPQPSIDESLADAVGDSSAEVRRAAVTGLGLRRALSREKKVRNRFEDDDEVDFVRAAAALSLGMMCDRGAVDILTKSAGKLTSAAEDSERLIGQSAVAALSMLKPSDLGQRLAPLLSKQAPPAVRRLANEALAAQGRCAVAAKPR